MADFSAQIQSLQQQITDLKNEIGDSAGGVYANGSTRLSVLEGRLNAAISDPGTTFITDFVAGQDLQGSAGAQRVIKINGASVPAAGALTSSHVLQVNGSASLIYALLNNNNIDANANISGTKISPDFGSQTIQTTGGILGSSVQIGTGGPQILKGSGVPGSSPPNGSVYFRTDGDATTAIYSRVSNTWVPINNSSSSFSASGDLSGNNTSQNVLKIHGASVPIAGALTTNHVLKVAGASATTYGYIADNNIDAAAAITGTKISPNFGSQNVQTTGSIKGSSILLDSGPSITYGSGVPVAAANNGSVYFRSDGSNITAIYSRQSGAWVAVGSASFTASGDLGGSNTNQSVLKINGTSVLAGGSLTTNTVLKVSGAAATTYGYILDANIDSAAGIAGTKISPNFGSQNIQTSGDTTSGKYIFSATSANILSGSGVPASSVANGSIYLRNDGTNSTAIYVRQGGSWSVVSGGGSFTAATDLSGSSSSQTVIRINGATVPSAGALTTNHLLKVSGAAATTYGYLIDANVDSAAAIAGSKISPNFAAQNITTTGTTQTTSLILGSSGPTITKGTGVPATTPPDGSIFLRTNGDASSGLYTRQAGSWAAIGGAGSVTFSAVNSALATASTTVDFNAQQINNVTSGTTNTSLVNKLYTDRHVPQGWANVKNYGAVGDGVADDLPAFLATIADMKANGMGTLFIPAGIYYMSDNLFLDIACVMQGVGVGWFDKSTDSVIKFAPYKGLITDGILTSASGTSAEYCLIRNITFKGGHATGTPGLAPDLHPVWQASHAFVVGDKIVPTFGTKVSTFAYHPRCGDTFEFYYECVKAGTTSGTQPAWQDPDNGFFLDYTTPWQANHSYNFSATVRAPNRFDVAFKVTTPTYFPPSTGTSSATIPAAFATAVIGDVITDNDLVWLCFDSKSLFVSDGTVVWSRKECAGIQCRTTTSVENCMFEYFLNAGIFVQALSTFNNSYPTNINPNFPEPTAIANVCCFRACRILHCGVGIFNNSADANAHRFEWLSVLGRLSSPRDVREIGVSEQSFLGNYYDNLHVAGFGGPGYLVRGGVNSSNFSNVYVEGDCNPNEIFCLSSSFGPGGIKNAFTSDSQFHGVATPSDWRNVVGRSINSDGIELHSYLKNDANSAFGWDTVSSEAAAGFKIAYENAWMGRGYWTITSANSRATMGWSNQRAPEGFGHVRFPHGFVEGSQSDKRFYFATTDDLNDNGSRFGYRAVGDYARSNSYALRGGFAEKVCTTAGYVAGGAWFGSYSANSGNMVGPYATASSLIVPTVRNGYVYMCTKTGTTGGAEPTFPTTIGVIAKTWVNTGEYYQVGSKIRPSTPNTYIYTATAISGGREEAYSSTEPTWGTTPGGTTVDAAGITWQCASDDTATWVADGTAIWTCVGIEAVFDGAAQIVPTATTTTSNGTIKTIDKFPAATNTSKYFKFKVMASDATNQEQAIWYVEFSYIRNSGSETIVMPQTITTIASNVTGTAWAPGIGINGSHEVELTVTGATGRNLVWTSVLENSL